MTAGAFAGAIQIKCPRCAAFNHLRPESPSPQRQDRDGKDASCGSSFPRKT
ncbi:Com family DNA-binding transcriptional regulator [Tabrizicola sp. SY72]|nr:Com family DNA-binding transcriptional regulator [Tabrizicola sp. SY72]